MSPVCQSEITQARGFRGVFGVTLRVMSARDPDALLAFRGSDTLGPHIYGTAPFATLPSASSFRFRRSHPYRGRMRHYVGQPKISALEQQRCAHDGRDRIGHAVAEIQLCGMASRPAESVECPGRGIRHLAAERNNYSRARTDKVFEPLRRTCRQVGRAPEARLHQRGGADCAFVALKKIEESAGVRLAADDADQD